MNLSPLLELDHDEFNKAFEDRLDSPSRYVALETPEQIHISLTSKPSEIVVVWVTFGNSHFFSV